MSRYVRQLGGVAFALAAVTGCENTATISKVQDFEPGKTHVTTADLRTINRVKVTPNHKGGGVIPDYVTCAEPSPDVAKAISSAFQLSNSIAVSGLPSGVSPKAAVAISRAQAESVAQLGERLATIQLLRDGLYRACEAYANGAINETIYAVLVSRYDDTMVTLLMGELAAGAFGRSLAALESGSGAAGTASLDLAEQSRQVRESVGNFQKASVAKEGADAALKEEQDKETKKQAELEAAKKRQEDARAEAQKAEAQTNPEATEEVKESLAQGLKQSDDEVARLNTELERTRGEIARLEAEQSGTNRRFRQAEQERDLKLAAVSSAAAGATAKPGGTIEPGKQDSAVAQVIHDIQRKYVENINSDATEIACLSAMERNPTGKLATFCETTLLGKIADGKNKLHQLLIARETMKLKREGGAIDVMIDPDGSLGTVEKPIPTTQPLKITETE